MNAAAALDAFAPCVLDRAHVAPEPLAHEEFPALDVFVALFHACRVLSFHEALDLCLCNFAETGEAYSDSNQGGNEIGEAAEVDECCTATADDALPMRQKLSLRVWGDCDLQKAYVDDMTVEATQAPLLVEEAPAAACLVYNDDQCCVRVEEARLHLRQALKGSNSREASKRPAGLRLVATIVMTLRVHWRTSTRHCGYGARGAFGGIPCSRCTTQLGALGLSPSWRFG